MYDAGGRELRTHLHSCTAFSLFLQPQTRTKAALGGVLTALLLLHPDKTTGKENPGGQQGCRRSDPNETS